LTKSQKFFKQGTISVGTYKESYEKIGEFLPPEKVFSEKREKQG